MTSGQYSNTAQMILFDPISLGADRLCILSDQASPNMASWLLKTYEEKKISGISIELIITSSLERGILQTNHSAFIELHRAFRKGKSNTFICSYYHGVQISKKNYYIWMNGDTPLTAFSFSYDFTQSSFLKSESNSVSKSNASEAYKTYEAAVDTSTYCVNSEVEDYVPIVASPLPTAADLTADDPNYICLSLVVEKTKEPGKKSGLNWGQRKNAIQTRHIFRFHGKLRRVDSSLWESGIFWWLRMIITLFFFVWSSRETRQLARLRAMLNSANILGTVSDSPTAPMYIPRIWMHMGEETFRFIKSMMSSTTWISQ